VRVRTFMLMVAQGKTKNLSQNDINGDACASPSGIFRAFNSAA
jgi:hypothetical protein